MGVVTVWAYRADRIRLDGPPDYVEVQGARRQPGTWFACEQPERPWDAWETCLHDCCQGCLISAEATVARGDVVNCIETMRDRLAEWGPAPRLERTA